MCGLPYPSLFATVVCGVTDSGDDDELIQLQRLQAEDGHVPSMIAMADLLYFGAHGVRRNQAEAFHWCAPLLLSVLCGFARIVSPSDPGCVADVAVGGGGRSISSSALVTLLLPVLVW